jgi:hypothetical protein
MSWLKNETLKEAGWKGISEYQFESMALTALLPGAVWHSTGAVRSIGFRGKLPPELQDGKLVAEVVKMTHGVVGYRSGFGDSHQVVFFDTGVVSVNLSGDIVNVSGMLAKEDVVNDLRSLRDLLLPIETARQVFVITKRGGDLYLDSIGMGAVTLERENYHPDVIEGYDYVVSELQSTSPAGRLVLLEGPPGTGKTFMIRGLVDDVPKATFVIVPPKMIGELGSPEIVPLLVEEKRRGVPLIFILEDADEAVTRRTKGSGDKLPIVSSVLNLGDGILGSLLDVRVVATTNAPEVRLDTAVTRKGRLLKRLTLKRLEADQAGGVLARLVGEEKALTGGDPPWHIKATNGDNNHNPSLADVYMHARTLGWLPPKIEDNGDDEEDDD